MQNRPGSEIITEYFSAYQTKNRAVIEKLLTPDFTFTSPVDDNLSRQRYFERCWPHSKDARAFHMERFADAAGGTFVTYESERMNGSRFRNTEFFTFEGNLIKHVAVYFGGNTGEGSPEDAIRALCQGMTDACRSRNADKLMCYFARDVTAFDLINPLRYAGAEEVGRRAREWFESFQGSIEYEMQDLTITASPDTAFCHSLNRVSGTKTDGAPVEMWWRATLCWQMREHRWFITHTHSSEPFDMENGRASLDLQP